MLKILKINGNDYTAKASISVFVAYKNLFNRELAKDLQIIEKVQDELNFGETIEILEKIVYAFIYNSNRKVKPFKDWKEEVEEFNVFEQFEDLQELIANSANSLVNNNQKK